MKTEIAKVKIVKIINVNHRIIMIILAQRTQIATYNWMILAQTQAQKAYQLFG